jgi:hypothetical protein
LHSRMRVSDRDLIRGEHYGQRSCEPHSKAEHMAAPTRLRREDSPCQLGAVHTWPIATKFSLGLDVSFWGEAEVIRAAEPNASVENDRLGHERTDYAVVVCCDS